MTNEKCCKLENEESSNNFSFLKHDVEREDAQKIISGYYNQENA